MFIFLVFYMVFQSVLLLCWRKINLAPKMPHFQTYYKKPKILVPNQKVSDIRLRKCRSIGAVPNDVVSPNIKCPYVVSFFLTASFYKGNSFNLSIRFGLPFFEDTFFLFCINDECFLGAHFVQPFSFYFLAIDPI